MGDVLGEVGCVWWSKQVGGVGLVRLGMARLG